MTCNEAYDVLQISCGASDSEVKAAYRSLMKKFHPDNFSRFDDPEAVRMAEEKSKEINEAYETVSRGRADGSASRPSYGSTTETRTSHETTTGTRTAHETSAGSRTSHETTTGFHTSHETTTGSRTAYTPPPNPGTRSGPETYSAEQAWTGNAGYDPKRTAAGKQGGAGRMALKYLLNVLLAPLYVLAWPAFAVMNFLTGVLAYVLWGAAGIGFAADCICWFIGKQEFGQFCLILIPIAIGVGLPFLFRLGDDLLESLIDSLHDFLTTPADLW